MKRNIIAIAFAAALSVSAYATTHEQHGSAHVAAAAAASYSEGEVRKVDLDAKKITLRHGPLVNLDMPAMTMVFQVSDAAFLNQVKTGDKVRFVAEKIGGAYTVTQIHQAQ
ncbi:MAG TPA: copper-binding protein [Vicinamibacterales bacterium]|nr:copper-binding protein [Vicinamibacterales bacterium]